MSTTTRVVFRPAAGSASVAWVPISYGVYGHGRELLGAEFDGGGTGRNSDYDSIAPEIISGVSIYKNPTAELIETELGDEVDLHTPRPLDYKPNANADWETNR